MFANIFIIFIQVAENYAYNRIRFEEYLRTVPSTLTEAASSATSGKRPASKQPQAAVPKTKKPATSTANIKLHAVEGKRAAPPAQPAAENRQGKAAKVASTSSSSARIPDELTTAVSAITTAANSFRDTLSARETLEKRLIERLSTKSAGTKADYEKKRQELTEIRRTDSSLSVEQQQMIKNLEADVSQLQKKVAESQVSVFLYF